MVGRESPGGGVLNCGKLTEDAANKLSVLGAHLGCEKTKHTAVLSIPSLPPHPPPVVALI